MPITLHSELSCYNPFFSKPSWSDLSSLIMFHIKTFNLISIQFISVSFCPNMMFWLPSSLIVYFHVVIHSFPIRPDNIHHIQSHYILKSYYCNTFSSFPPNMIFQILSHTIAYFKVVIHSITSRHNSIHHLLSCSLSKPLCCDTFNSFLPNLIH